MTGVAALVPAAAATARVFGPTFYATAATVIPILFLALAVQGPGFQHMLLAATTAREQPSAREPGNPLLLFPRWVLLTAAHLIMIASSVGKGDECTSSTKTTHQASKDRPPGCRDDPAVRRRHGPAARIQHRPGDPHGHLSAAAPSPGPSDRAQ
jgi:hypothetical protein